MLKSKIEAILFLTDKPMRAQAIARIVNEDVQMVRQSILELINDYEGREGGLEIADDNGYIIQVKDNFASIIDEFVPMEMPLALLRTLSAIAIKQPVPQSEVIKIRGAGAYDHIKELVERELINKKEDGRSPMLSTTKKFQEYFRLSHDAKDLRTELRKQDKAEADEGTESSAEAESIDPNSAHGAVAGQLELLFEQSPDNSLVYRPNDSETARTPEAGNSAASTSSNISGSIRSDSEGSDSTKSTIDESGGSGSNTDEASSGAE